MLSLEMIGVVGAVFAALVYATVRTQLAIRQAEPRQKIVWERR